MTEVQIIHNHLCITNTRLTYPIKLKTGLSVMPRGEITSYKLRLVDLTNNNVLFDANIPAINQTSASPSGLGNA